MRGRTFLARLIATDGSGRAKIQLSGRTAIITGAAQGIGAAVARAFAHAGANLCVVDLSTERVQVGVTGFGPGDARTLAIACDVTRRDQVQTMINALCQRFGGVDILVNNAGIIRPAMLHKMTEVQWDEVLDVHLKGSFNCL